MGPFASVDDYAARFGPVADEAALAACLDDASDVMRAEMDLAGVGYSDPDEALAARLVRVCRAMAHRALGDGDGGCAIPFGASQFSQTGGPYTASATLANPYGDLFMTEAERRSLGIGTPRARVCSPYA